MDFEKFFEEIGLWEEGRESFRMLHEKMSEKEYLESYEAYKESDDAFSSYLSAYSERENIPIEVVTLYLYIRFSEYTYEDYKRRGISEDIFYNTMSDFAVTSHQNVDKGGVYGITTYPERPWLRLHLSCKLFRLGRLQFEIMESERDVDIDGKKLNKGDMCLNVHIARYSPLDDYECEKSYAWAREFFKKYYGIETCFFFCHSWFLHPWLHDVLPERSTILRFAKKYKILEVEENADEVIYYVFIEKHENIDDYPEDTSLRRNLKKYLKNGIEVGEGLGVRL